MTMKLDELQALLAKATAGEWFQPDGEGGHIWNNDAEPGEGYVPDRHIVAGPNKPSWAKDRTSDEWLAENADNLAAIVAAVNFCRDDLPALVAERDAALARVLTAEAERDRRQLRYPNAIAEGHRRATAEIVAWLRACDWCSESNSYANAFADAIESGVPAPPAP